MKTTYDKLAKIYTTFFGHIAKMAATPIYGKNPLKVFFSRTRRPMTFGLGVCSIGVWGLPSVLNDDFKLTLTYLMSMSNLLLMHLNGIFLNTVEAKVFSLT